MKFGTKIPRNVKEDMNFDNENGNTHCEDTINNEHENVIIAFKKVQDGDKLLSGVSNY